MCHGCLLTTNMYGRERLYYYSLTVDNLQSFTCQTPQQKAPKARSHRSRGLACQCRPILLKPISVASSFRPIAVLHHFFSLNSIPSKNFTPSKTSTINNVDKSQTFIFYPTVIFKFPLPPSSHNITNYSIEWNTS